MGLWNGFHRIYLVSGSLFGVYSVVHNTYLWLCRKYNRDVVFGAMPPLATKWISIFVMFHLASFALYIFSGRCPFLPFQ
jgi:membrane protein involved in D-alanine export